MPGRAAFSSQGRRRVSLRDPGQVASSPQSLVHRRGWDEASLIAARGAIKAASAGGAVRCCCGARPAVAWWDACGETCSASLLRSEAQLSP